MQRTKRMIGKRIAQALVAMVLMLVVAQGALASRVCECPDCPAGVRIHVDCIGGGAEARCPDLTSDTCPGAFAGTLAPAPRMGSLFGAGIVIAAPSAAAGDSAGAKRIWVPRFAAPPAHIVFCRLLR